jgi:hypothetical protein
MKTRTHEAGREPVIVSICLKATLFSCMVVVVVLYACMVVVVVRSCAPACRCLLSIRTLQGMPTSRIVLMCIHLAI